MNPNQTISKGHRRNRAAELELLRVSRDTSDPIYAADAAGFWLEFARTHCTQLEGPSSDEFVCGTP